MLHAELPDVFLAKKHTFDAVSVEGKMRAAVGKAQLLTTKKFKQFRGLCQQEMVSEPRRLVPAAAARGRSGLTHGHPGHLSGKKKFVQLSSLHKYSTISHIIQCLELQLPIIIITIIIYYYYYFYY